MPDIKLLSPDDWRTLRQIRLSALRDSPDAFLSTYALEETYDEAKWRAEFTRGDWYVGVDAGRPGDEPVSLVGITREPGQPAGQCFMEYLWIAPEFRGKGIAFEMTRELLKRLGELGIRSVFLWVLDGNDRAARFYERLGFVSCNHRQPLAAHPGRSEELMQRELRWPGGIARPCASPAS